MDPQRPSARTHFGLFSPPRSLKALLPGASGRKPRTAQPCHAQAPRLVGREGMCMPGRSGVRTAYDTGSERRPQEGGGFVLLRCILGNALSLTGNAWKVGNEFPGAWHFLIQIALLKNKYW